MTGEITKYVITNLSNPFDGNNTYVGEARITVSQIIFFPK